MLFAAATAVLYYIIPRKYRWTVLILANTAFYIYGGSELIVYLIGASVIAYISGIIMNKMF